MTHTLTVSDELYQRLEEKARRRGLASVEALLNTLAQEDQASANLYETVRRIDDRRERLAAAGQMADSVASLREDRAR